MNKYFTLIFVALLSVLSFETQAQVTVTVSYTGTAGSGLSASYGSLANAITALNGTTITGTSGNVVLTVTNATGTTETAPSTGYVITKSGSSSVGIVINGANIATITAPVWTGDYITRAIGSKFLGVVA